jgi:putative oxidoreductase
MRTHTTTWQTPDKGATLRDTLSAERLSGPAHALLRVGAGLLFMQHGAQKLFGMLGGFGGTPGATADLVSLMGAAGVLEFFGGLLVVVGLFARPVALLLLLQMAGAWFIAHAPQGWVPIQNGGELALLFLLVWAWIAAAGAGPWSVDALRAQGGETPAAAPVQAEAAARQVSEPRRRGAA